MHYTNVATYFDAAINIAKRKQEKRARSTGNEQLDTDEVKEKEEIDRVTVLFET